MQYLSTLLLQFTCLLKSLLTPTISSNLFFLLRLLDSPSRPRYVNKEKPATRHSLSRHWLIVKSADDNAVLYFWISSNRIKPFDRRIKQHTYLHASCSGDVSAVAVVVDRMRILRIAEIITTISYGRLSHYPSAGLCNAFAFKRLHHISTQTSCITYSRWLMHAVSDSDKPLNLPGTGDEAFTRPCPPKLTGVGTFKNMVRQINATVNGYYMLLLGRIRSLMRFFFRKLTTSIVFLRDFCLYI